MRYRQPTGFAFSRKSEPLMSRSSSRWTGSGSDISPAPPSMSFTTAGPLKSYKALPMIFRPSGGAFCLEKMAMSCSKRVGIGHLVDRCRLGRGATGCRDGDRWRPRQIGGRPHTATFIPRCERREGHLLVQIDRIGNINVVAPSVADQPAHDGLKTPAAAEPAYSCSDGMINRNLSLGLSKRQGPRYHACEVVGHLQRRVEVPGLVAS